MRHCASGKAGLSGKAPLPTTLAAWERGLVDRFLKIGDGGDSTPIRSFEITANSLASVFPEAQATAEEAEASFREAVRADRYTYRALRDGRPYPMNTDVPNCFGYLCASLLIDTLLDGAYSGQGQFRDRLRIWLGASQKMMQLSGIASMWRDLAHWLDKRVAADGNFRRLILPDPRNWRQIGHTRRLSFPTRTDLRFLERVLASFARGSSDAPGLIRAIEAAIERHSVSWGMEMAFAEFRDAFRGGGALVGHRFWQLVLRAELALPTRPLSIVVALQIEFDEDGWPEFHLDNARVPNLASAMAAPTVNRSANLGVAAQRGVVFFRQSGMARWTAESDPPPGQVRLAVAPAYASIARGVAVEFEQSGSWLITKTPINARTTDDILTRLRLGRLRRERLIDVVLEGAVHSGGGLLGRPKFLPRVEVVNRKVIVRQISEDDTKPATVHCTDGALVASTPLHGRYEILVRSDQNEQETEWSKRVQFFQDARPHPERAYVAERETPISEWATSERNGIACVEIANPTWAMPAPGISDLLEAIYASGRSGLSDAEVLDLIYRAGASGVVWETLRSIQEAGFLRARQRSRWRGRVWTLEPPHLVPNGKGVILAGAACALLQEEFREVTTAAGGTPFRSVPRSIWSPPVVGAINVHAGQIASVLGWEVADAQAAPTLTIEQFEISPLLAENHVLASSWDWDRRRFSTQIVAPSDVTITRWVHPGGRDHDQYRVVSPFGETRHATRVAAILKGHVAASVAMFQVNGDALVRTANEGALPVEIAQWLRRHAGEGGGPTAEGSYIYPLGGVSVLALAKALPNCIAGIPLDAEQFNHDPMETAGSEIIRARRSGGRVRLRWTDGMVRAA